MNPQPNQKTPSYLLIKGLVRKANDQSIVGRSDDPINWSLPFSPPGWLSQRQYIQMVRNLICGEEATVQACKILQSRLGPGLYYDFLETQINDEIHHAKLYHQYLDLLADDIEPSSGWHEVLEKCLNSHTTVVELILAFHILLEGEAVFLQKLIGEYISCPLFADINNKIRNDEARHVAFGRIMLPPLSAQLSAREKKKLMLWAEDIWFASALALVAEYFDPGAVQPDILDQTLRARWLQQEDILINLGLMNPGLMNPGMS